MVREFSVVASSRRVGKERSPPKYLSTHIVIYYYYCSSKSIGISYFENTIKAAVALY